MVNLKDKCLKFNQVKIIEFRTSFCSTCLKRVVKDRNSICCSQVDHFARSTRQSRNLLVFVDWNVQLKKESEERETENFRHSVYTDGG